MQYGQFAQIYDRLMQEVDYDAWASYILNMLPANTSLLECACGTGEITLRLASAGHQVIAADISEDMLRVAFEKLRLKGRLMNKVHFVNMDMRSISLNKMVDCVVSCCDGVNYLTADEDAKRFFNGVNAVLRPNGLLLFDVSSQYKLKHVLGQNCFVDNSVDTPYLWQNYYDDNSRLIRMDLAFFVKSGKLYERFDETHIQRAYAVEELTAMLRECGFAVEAYEFLTHAAPKADSERIQFVARKQANT